MQKIKILEHQEAIKIAAGEVVERPSNILKELIENSIDAGATQITIHSNKSGKELLSISDNGCGMSPEDANLCFEHHATSKISTVDDLETIITYGFRGEALSSIASVSNVQLTTKTDDNKIATQLNLEFGKIIQEQKVSHPTGTTIKITKLFDAIPARKKFLKSDDAEWNSIISIFQAFCLRYTNIYFKIFHDDKLAYNCPIATNITQRCAQLCSNDLYDQLITIEPTTKNNITISGATTKSHYHRYNRNQIFTFVNNRWVKNIELSRAIIKGYQNVLPNQKYPATFLFIEIDPKQVDINIHPKKEEVRFLHTGIIQTFIQETITETLNKSISPKTTVYLVKQSVDSNIEQNNTQEFQPKIITFQQQNHFDNHNFENNINLNELFNSHELTTKELSQEVYTIESTNNNSIQHHQIVINSTSNENTKETNAKENDTTQINQSIYTEEPYSIIGQFNNTYILIEQNNQLLIIDQHAAHERILYENFKKNFTNVATVQLLFPQVIKLSQQDIVIVCQHIELFKTHGIILEQFSQGEIIIQATPVSLQHKALTEIIQATISWIKEHQFIEKTDFFKELNESIHTQKACKAAFKAGDILNIEQIENIVKTLFKTENRFCCPHGRPVMWNLSLKEIEKYFKRDYKGQQNINMF